VGVHEDVIWNVLGLMLTSVGAKSNKLNSRFAHHRQIPLVKTHLTHETSI